MNAAQESILARVEHTLGADARQELAERWAQDGVGADADPTPRREELQRLAAWRFSPITARRMIAIQRLAHLGYAVTLDRVHVNDGLRELLAGRPLADSRHKAADRQEIAA